MHFLLVKLANTRPFLDASTVARKARDSADGPVSFPTHTVFLTLKSRLLIYDWSVRAMKGWTVQLAIYSCVQRPWSVTTVTWIQAEKRKWFFFSTNENYSLKNSRQINTLTNILTVNHKVNRNGQRSIKITN